MPLVHLATHLHTRLHTHLHAHLHAHLRTRLHVSSCPDAGPVNCVFHSGQCWALGFHLSLVSSPPGTPPSPPLPPPMLLPVSFRSLREPSGSQGFPSGSPGGSGGNNIIVVAIVVAFVVAVVVVAVWTDWRHLSQIPFHWIVLAWQRGGINPPPPPPPHPLPPTRPGKREKNEASADQWEPAKRQPIKTNAMT